MVPIKSGLVSFNQDELGFRDTSPADEKDFSTKYFPADRLWKFDT